MTKMTGKMKARAVKTVTLVVDGGAGKNVSASVVIRGIRQKFPEAKVVVICGYPDVFKFNPNVHRCFPFQNTPNYYDDFVVPGDGLFIKVEPYLHQDYIYKGTRSLPELWCEMADVPYDGNPPEMFFTAAEKERAKNFIRSKGKPVMLIQASGGVPPQKDQPTPKMFCRDLPMEVVEEVIRYYQKRYHILSLQAPTQPTPAGAEKVSYPMRLSLALIPHCSKLLLIDSLGQHAAAALGIKAVVCWMGTSPDLLGYPIHTNLRKKECPNPECHRPNSYLFDKDTTLNPWECPYGEMCRNYTAKEIIETLGE